MGGAECTFQEIDRSKYAKPSSDELKRKDEQVVNCIRCLSMDAVQAANSGHPGTPMAMAPVGYALWTRELRFDPSDPIWANRDLFVLSMGHASMLEYSLLHLAGVKEVTKDYEVTEKESVTLDQIRNFRQYGSKCPGHPEYRWTSGVETTTGPLGQGVATSVGMAIASKWKAATFNKPGFDVFNYDTYALCGDGCLQEGVSAEAASLAGHLKLDNLCWIWDNNNITIEGSTDLAFTEDVTTRFISYGWNVLRVGDANDLEMLGRAFATFKKETNRPTLIVVDSHIAWGAPTKQDTHGAHGAPLGLVELSGTKAFYGWPNETFLVPEEVLTHFRSQMAERGTKQRKEWENMFSDYQNQYPKEAAMITAMQKRELPVDWDQFCKEYPADPKGLASRQSSGECLNMMAQGLPWLLGGSADLAPSCLTTLKFKGATDFQPPGSGAGDFSGRNFHFGIREHAMGSIMNGMAVSKLRPFGSTFFVFSDYMKPPIRLSAIMEIPCIWIFTHDSIGVGEDGPTHQPIEQLSALRSIPELLTFRPGDANETLEMWKYIMPMKSPAAVVLSRQNLPTLDRTKYGKASGLANGAYILVETPGPVELILIATGSEVQLMLQVYDQLVAEGVQVRAVSMPCMELFLRQSAEYQESVLPDSCRARVSIEAAGAIGWHRFIGMDGAHVGMDSFGASAPLKDLLEAFGFTVPQIMETAKKVLKRSSK